jgi:uncharacterized damage-inducible protein DinB
MMAAMPWTAPQPDLADGPLVGLDRPMMEGYLRWQRGTLLNICAGLTGDQLVLHAVPSTNLTLLGLVRHLAKVERVWFRQRFGSQDIPPMYDATLGPDADFDDLDESRAEADFARFVEECRLADEAVAPIPFDTTIEHRGDVICLRFIYLHVIHEYARHNGHADLLREAIDGTTGR